MMKIEENQLENTIVYKKNEDSTGKG